MPTSIIAEVGGRPAGYAWYVPLASEGYVHNLAVSVGARGGGLGRVLLDEVSARLRRAGCRAWRLNVKVGNEPAIGLYQRMGMREAHRSTGLTLEWPAVERLPAAGRRLEVGPVEPGEDERLEQAFDLPAGQLAWFRTVTGQVLAVLLDQNSTGGSPVGFARFDPGFPGAFPFKVREPAAARALLEGLRPHALPGADRLHLLVEDQPDLVELLCGAGAVRTIELIHMRGPI